MNPALSPTELLRHLVWYTVGVSIPSALLERQLTSPEVERCAGVSVWPGAGDSNRTSVGLLTRKVHGLSATPGWVQVHPLRLCPSAIPPGAPGRSLQPPTEGCGHMLT